MALSEITVRGAREHNLKNVDVRIPRERLVVITGLSGSGKSSLAFDTLYAEGQRRYVESLSSYARQFLGQMKKPEVEHVEGLSPAISIDQKTVHRNPRSTVGTVTEIYDYLRLLFAHVGTPHCPQCGEAVSKQSPQEICKQVLQMPEGTKAQVLAPIVRGRKGTYQKEFKELRAKGYARARVNGKVVSLDEPPSLKRYEKHTIEAVVDRIVVKPSAKSRIQDSLEEALKESGGLVVVEVPASGKKKAKEYMFSERFACAGCGVNLPEIVPRVFSFNSPHGACEDCSGLGFRLQVDEDKIVVDPDAKMMSAFHPSVHRINAWSLKWLRSLAREVGVDLRKPFKRLPKGFREVVLYGTEFEGGSPTRDRYSGGWEFEGLIPRMERLYHESDSSRMKMRIESFQREIPCKKCKGERLRPGVLAVRIDDENIMDVTRMHIAGALQWFDTLPQRLGEYKARIAEEVIKEIRARLGFLKDVGLGYLSLSRASGTLSGGEAQRIRLATQIGSGLVGVLYILDEPSIGLHQRDNKRLLATLMHLRDQGNTVIVVEHDEETMWSADHLIDLGPGAGALGGKLIAQGTPQEVAATEGSVTGAYLSGRMEISVPEKRRSGSGKRLVVKSATANNLKRIDVGFPLGKMICVTGVSGSGKSTLVNEVLVKGSKMRLMKSGEVPGEHKQIQGLDHVDKIIVIDQSPIGRTPRSNPATYTGLFTPIRELFAATQQAKQRGYRPGRFSFNVKGGRCEACTGDGIVTIEMHFLPDVHVPCEVCKGARYQEETLEVTYKGKSIRQVLDMSVDEAMKFYEPVPAIHRKLKTLHDVGLGYIRLGQPATTLSGGEAQRVKLATELSKRSTGRTLYVLDEPTTGMHAHDMTYLLKVLNRLADGGNTVVVIEHNLDVIKTADHVIDLGPEGGDEGGYVVAKGTPEEVARTDTWTGRYLREILEKATLVDDAVKQGKRAHLETPVVG